MKNNIKLYVGITIGFIMGITCLVYANTYNSSEISYDNSISHAEATNIKDAIDWLYTNAGMKGECPEDMTCIESPVVTINSSGPGNVNKDSMHVRINGNNKFTVTPDSGFTLNSIICTSGYSLSSFKTLSNEAINKQEITVTNNNVNIPGTCEVKFSTNEIIVSSTQRDSNGRDKCNNKDSGCICYQIKNNVANFTYEDHTGCNFKSKTCNFNGSVSDCVYLNWQGSFWGGDPSGSGIAYGSNCSGTITCAT